ncbi:DUF5643 domain-containing protein [Paenibacillus wulumuqiensis]|uniref:DUF5643 domain-containing protein n=1 Tax=Paenibacillus wulumuqiensis TaxID=1567107 RepID=UPI000619B377|nr:DUF5643 domain-containing protein [Paenibacillus wulumuqiensis]
MRPDELDRMLNKEKQKQDRPLNEQSRARLEQTYARIQGMEMPAAQPEQSAEENVDQPAAVEIMSHTSAELEPSTEYSAAGTHGKGKRHNRQHSRRRTAARRWWYAGIGTAAAVMIFAAGLGGSSGWSLGNVPVLGSWIQPESAPKSPAENVPAPNPAAVAPEINQSVTHGDETITITRASLIDGDMQIEYRANSLEVLEKVSLDSIRYEGRGHVNSVMTFGNPVKQTGVFEAKAVDLPDSLPAQTAVEIRLTTGSPGSNTAADADHTSNNPVFDFRIPAEQIGRGKVLNVGDTRSASKTGHSLKLDKVLYTPLMVSVELSSAGINDPWISFEAEDDQGHVWKSIGGGELDAADNRLHYQVAFMDGEITPSARTITIKPYYQDATTGQNKYLTELNFTIPATQ